MSEYPQRKPRDFGCLRLADIRCLLKKSCFLSTDVGDPYQDGEHTVKTVMITDRKIMLVLPDERVWAGLRRPAHLCDGGRRLDEFRGPLNWRNLLAGATCGERFSDWDTGLLANCCVYAQLHSIRAVVICADGYGQVLVDADYWALITGLGLSLHVPLGQGPTGPQPTSCAGPIGLPVSNGKRVCGLLMPVQWPGDRLDDRTCIPEPYRLPKLPPVGTAPPPQAGQPEPGAQPTTGGPADGNCCECGGPCQGHKQEEARA